MIVLPPDVVRVPPVQEPPPPPPGPANGNHPAPVNQTRQNNAAKREATFLTGIVMS
jgi:hypothetical protein